MKDLVDIPEKFELVLSGASSKKSNGLKESIDKKLAKIQKIKGQLDRLREQIEMAKKLFTKHVVKDENILNKSVEKLILKLYERINQKSFSLWQLDLMESKLLNEIDFLVDRGYQSVEIERIQKELAEKHANDLDEEQEGFMNAMAKDLLKNMGVEVDDEDFDFREFTDPSFQEKMNKEFTEQHQEQKKKHRDAHQEEKVRTTDKDFQKLYRTLVKRAHPDLVSDPEEKEQRETWMKQLSHAWEVRDYYTLLLLQKQIDVDSSLEIDITQNMLKPLIANLDRELSDLEVQKYILKNENPDTSFYHQNFRGASEKVILRKIREYGNEIHHHNLQVQEEYNRLKTQKSTKEMLREIEERRDPFDMFFG